MPRHLSLQMTSLIDTVPASFTQEYRAVKSQMLNELAPLHTAHSEYYTSQPNHRQANSALAAFSLYVSLA